MTLYFYLKERKGLREFIFAFSLFLASLSFYLGYAFYGVIFTIIFMISSLYLLISTIRHPEEVTERYAEAMKKTKITKEELEKPLMLRDFLSWRGWLKVAYKYGESKAACIWTLFVLFMLVVILVFLKSLNLFDIRIFDFVSLVVFLAIFNYYFIYRAFQKCLKGVIKCK